MINRSVSERTGGGRLNVYLTSDFTGIWDGKYGSSHPKAPTKHCVQLRASRVRYCNFSLNYFETVNI